MRIDLRIILILFLCTAGTAYAVTSYTSQYNSADGNKVYSEIYAKNNAVATVIPLIDTYVTIDEGATTGQVNNLTVAAGTTTIQVAGKYSAIASVNAIGGNNKVFHMTFGIDHVEQNNYHSPRKVAAADIGSWSLSCVLDLSVGEEVTLMVENADDDSNVTITDFNYQLFRIGI